MKAFLKKNFPFISLVFVGAFLRFFNPVWDNSLYLHPDERLFVNASNLALPNSWNQFFSVASPLNPHMFYYGSLLLYIYKLLSLFSPFSLLETSRLFSALLSSLTIAIVFLIGRQLFSKKVGLLSSVVFAFAVGSIQYAHFDTTESALIFLVAFITSIDIYSVREKKPYLLSISLVLVGISAAIKITGLLFGISTLVALLLLLKERVLWKKISFWFFFGLVCSFVVYILLTPYQWIDFQTFLTQQSYMQEVTYGIFKPPFVLIYQNTLPYIYQLLQVFPFAFGFISFPLSLIGFVILIKHSLSDWKKHLPLLFLFAFPLIYFAWAGSWFAKYARYYLLLLPFMSIWTGFLLSKLSKIFLVICLLAIMANGILFVRIYFTENTRVVASRWVYNHIPNNATIATEHWDDALPLVLPDRPFTTHYHMLTLGVYNGETYTKLITISSQIASSDYIILSSRRVYASILQNKTLYPQTSTMYKKLFAGTLGFTKIYQKTNYPFFLSDDYFDETLQSYDHPPVIIFQNTLHLSPGQILSLLMSQ